jgi:hypothetical protein
MYVPMVSMFKCPKCEVTRPYDSPHWDRDSYDGVFCALCNEEIKFSHEQRASYVSMAVYETGRVYGGPEEGGWYYTAGNIIPETLRNYDVADMPQARLYKDQLSEKVKEWERDSDSRYEVKMRYDVTVPSHFPAVRPHYC